MHNTLSTTEHVTGVLPVTDLKSRLESLERSLKDMETRAAAHLGRRLEGTLTSALQITNVPRATLPSPAETAVVEEQHQQQLDYFSNLDNTQLDDVDMKVNNSPTVEQQQQQDNANKQPQKSILNNNAEEMMFQIVAHVENELGEAIRRCEKKVEMVTEVINEDLLSLIEDRLAARTVALEKKIEELEARLEQQNEGKRKEEEKGVAAAAVAVPPEKQEKTTEATHTPEVPEVESPQQQQDKEDDEESKVEGTTTTTNAITAKSMPAHVTEPISRMPTPPAKAPPSKPISRLADPSRSSIAKISPSPKKKPNTNQQQLTPRSSQASSATIKALQEAKAKIAHKKQARIQEEIAKQEAESTSLGSMLLRMIMVLIMFALGVVCVGIGGLSVLMLQGVVKAEDLGDLGGMLEWNVFNEGGK